MDQYEKSWPSWEYLCTVRLIASSQIVYQVIKFGCTKKGASDGQYRVTHLLADMGWVGLTLIWDDPQGVGLYCSCSAAHARQRNILNLNQPNPGPRGDGSPCRGTAAKMVAKFYKSNSERHLFLNQCHYILTLCVFNP